MAAPGWSGDAGWGGNEEAPDQPQDQPGRPYQLLPLSARSPAALRRAAQRLADELRTTSAPIADIAWTLQVGRTELDYRGFIVVSDEQDAASPLRGRFGDVDLVTAEVPAAAQTVTFAFSEYDLRYARTTGSLYAHEPAFCDSIDQCARLAESELDTDLREVLYPGGQRRPTTPEAGRMAVFAVQYALACLWRSWGVHPARVAGNGLGEYVAAVVADAVSLADALAMTRQPGVLPDRGPQALTRLLSRHGDLMLGMGPRGAFAGRAVLASLPESSDAAAATAMLNAVGHQWLSGRPIDWPRLHDGQRRRRVPLPTYPFERQRFRLDELHRYGTMAHAEIIDFRVHHHREQA